MFLNSEKNILNIIKYGPVVPLLIFSLIITLMLIDEKNQDLNQEIQTLKTNYLNENKVIIKNEITKVVDLIEFEIKESEESLKKFIKDKVYEAHKVSTNIYNEASKYDKSGHYLTKEQIFETIKYALAGMSYNDNRGYFFMDDVNGVKKLQPFNKSFEGKNFLEFTDPTGYKFIKKRVEVIKNKSESFDKYYWYKPNDKKNLFEKVSFYKYFEPYNVSIGTGEYVVDFENQLKEKVLEWLQKIKDKDNNYIFVYDLNGVALAHIKKEYLGVNKINMQDKYGNYIVRDVLSFAQKNKEGFINYNSSYNNNLNSSNKISYVKLLDKWGWMIGTGFYLDKLNKDIEIKEKELIKNNALVINQILSLSAISTLLLIFISFYISKVIANKFDKYKKNIQKELTKTIEKEKLLIQQSKMAMMGEMIGNIAHQWKQPLSLISMSNSLIKLDKEVEGFSTEEKVNEAIGNIDNSVMYLSTTIDDFKNFFNPNKEKTHFNMEDVFDKTFKLISSEFKNNNIQIIKNIANLNIDGNENELLQVLINIIKNAKDEFIKKDTQTDKLLLFIDVYQYESFAIIKIKDNIGGIKNEVIKDIFKPYFTTKKDSGGTGIGLYMSKQIIKNMDGKIEATNVEYEYEGEQHKGAEFKITLPLNNKDN